MQVNVSEIFHSGENEAGIYKVSGQQGAVSAVGTTEGKAPDEYAITSAQTFADDPVITRQNYVEQKPEALSVEQMNTLAENIGADDFSKYEELGITPEQDELGKVLTVSERIKIELATHCENYTGDVSDISTDLLESMYGSAGGAYAAKQQMQYLDMARSLKNIDENAKAYLLKNEMEPTVENVYMAQHSGSVSAGSPLSGQQWSQLKPQVEAALKKVGLEPDEAMLSEGRFLIEHGISLTPQNILKSLEMNADIEGKTDEDWLEAMTGAMVLGMSCGDTPAVGSMPDRNMVEDMMDAIRQGDEEIIGDIIESGKDVTILNLKNPPTAEEVRENEGRMREENREHSEEKEQDERILAQRKKMQDICQKMSYESFFVMLKAGIHVEILSMDELSVQVDRHESRKAEVFFSEYHKEKIDLFQASMDALERMKAVPSLVLGKVISGEVEFTVKDISAKGGALTARYGEAEKLYQAVGTEVRSDLGDSIREAFSSSYGLLGELGVEETEASRRAVRILGYNSMEITKENVLQVEALDGQIGKLFRNFTPQAVAYIIEHEINPLETDIAQLNENLTALNQEMGYSETESYSKYLWKLDKNNEISKEDRSAYIGLYKLIRRVEKGDRRAIGAVLKSGGEMTLKNLYHALENMEYKKGGIQVDDSLGLAQETVISENNLSQQLKVYEKIYDGAIDKIWHYTTPKQAKAIGIEQFQNSNLEDLADIIKQEETEEEYSRMRMETIQEARFVSEQHVEALLDSGVEVSVSNMLAAAYFASSPNGIFGKLKEENRKIPDSFEELDIENLEEEYPEKVEQSLEEISGQAGEGDVKTFRRLNRAIRLLGAMGQKHSYYVPVELSGETSTVRLTVDTRGTDKGKVSVEIHSAAYGKISAQFKRTEEGLAGTVLAETRKGFDLAAGAGEGMEAEYGSVKLERALVSHIGEGVFGAAASREDAVASTNRQLYRIAKSFIICIKDCDRKTDK